MIIFMVGFCIFEVIYIMFFRILNRLLGGKNPTLYSFIEEIGGKNDNIYL